MSETEILDAVRRFELRRKVGLALALLGIVATGALAVDFVPTASGRVGQPEFLAAGAAGILSIVAGLALMRIGRLPDDAKTPRIAMMRAERLQHRRHLALLFIPVSLACLLVGTVEAAGHVANGLPITHRDLFIVTAFTAFLLAFAALIGGRGLDRWARPVLDDELSRELRRQALTFGYAILLPSVAALLAIAIVSRALAVELIPVVAALGVAGPAIRLYLLERAADAADDDA